MKFRVQSASKPQVRNDATNAPIRPWTRPSTMNGSRMNQLLAPTRRMTSISRRRAKTAVRIALKIRSTDAVISAIPGDPHPGVERLDRPLGLPGVLRGVFDLLDPGLGLIRVTERRHDVGVGAGRLDPEALWQLLGLHRVHQVGLVLEQSLELVVGAFGVEEVDLADLGRLLELAADAVDLIRGRARGSCRRTAGRRTAAR